ncbi:type I glyceraldehyde-3-phosphate dehydrogenase [Candidatus Woesearchaeota archaeon]|nr:type I glyceraldehyde-3-phosphate dehydrogenase [Candidatus Woesearchaeota archaeon]
MAKTRIAINGFGRTGRCLIRQLYKHSSFDIAAINSRSPVNKHLLSYDSVYGKLDARITMEDRVKLVGRKQCIEHYLHIDKHEIPVFQSDEPIALPWEELSIDIVVDATGNFPTLKTIADHCEAGAKNVVMTYPPIDKSIKTIMVGVNEETYDPTADRVISAGSCTALALAPVLKYLDMQWGVTSCDFLATHSYTDSQNLLDNSNKDAWRARAAVLNIIPTMTGALMSIPAVLPPLAGKVTGMVNRVPVPACSQLFIEADIVKETTPKEVRQYFSDVAAKQSLIGMCDVPACSSYFLGSTHAVIIDPEWIIVRDGRKLRMVAWFDNEWGYSARLVALLDYVAKTKKKGWF